ncbi:MAG: hypothetical protein ACUZ8O_13585 [Candidatus Anammoxibacter sp.]
MKRTTIFADEELINEIKDISKDENRSVAEVVREAMVNYVKQKRKKPKKLSFIGIGDSGRSDISKNHEELIWKKEVK